MPHRSGGKITGSHSTVIDLSARVVDIIGRLALVKSIALGVIKPGQGSLGSTPRVKIGDSSGCLRLTVRQASSVQELRVFTDNGTEAQQAIARALRNEGIAIAFKKD